MKKFIEQFKRHFGVEGYILLIVFVIVACIYFAFKIVENTTSNEKETIKKETIINSPVDYTDDRPTHL